MRLLAGDLKDGAEVTELAAASGRYLLKFPTLQSLLNGLQIK